MGWQAFGVLGGTFDPVHRGHLALAEGVRDRTVLDRVLFLPSAVPPHKRQPRISPLRHRLAMLRLALEGRKGLELCTLEADSGSVRYTIDSMRELRQRDPAGARPVFLMGMDSLHELPTWKEYRKLVEEFDLIAVDRPGNEFPPREAPEELRDRLVDLASLGGAAPASAEGLGGGGRIFRVPLPPVPVSSSEIRARAAAGLDLADLVPFPVARYIHSQGLYKMEEGR
jgi:nicotinate-nucleotide adenylyltransferase